MNTRQVGNAINQFGFDILRQLWQEGGEKENVFISPASISFALTMTLNGAGGKTRSDMARALGVSEDRLDETNAAIRELIGDLEGADPDAKLEVANALFSKLGCEFKAEFIDANVANFRAEISPLDFSGDPNGSLKVINGWCNEKTHGKIPGILDRIDPSAAMFLLNAVYFKGMWATPFEKSQTTERAFKLLDGTSKQCQTMLNFGNSWPHFETMDFQCASLPYGNGRFVMDVFLPKEGKTVADLVGGFTGADFLEYAGRLRETDGVIYLPKFKLEYGAKLNDALGSAGMSIAFEPGAADFSNMVPPPSHIVIDEVRHKTFIEVNEEYTEAAAVTSVGMSFCTSVGVTRPRFMLDVNRPFLVTIRDTASGAILFLGAIVEPK